MDAATLTARDTIGANFPPPDPVTPESLKAHYSAEAIFSRHAVLITSVGDLEKKAGALLQVDSEAENETAAGLVRELRASITKGEAAYEGENRPLLDAGKVTGTLKRTLNDGATAHKTRLERLIGGFAHRKAEKERVRLAEAARLEREEATRATNLAAEAEAAAQPKLAEAMLDQGVRAEEVAEVHERIAAGPIHDLARTRTDQGTTTIRFSWVATITDPAALKATMGPLRDCFTADAVAAALRKFASIEKAAERIPSLPGVAFVKDMTGQVR